MRALALKSFGVPPAVMDLPAPEPGEGELLVRVGAASVNGFDVKVAAGLFKDVMPHPFPLVLGQDFAGTVAAVGAGVTAFSVGDRVFGLAAKGGVGAGTWAEYVTVPAAIGVAALPDDIDFTTAAAHGVASLTGLTILDEAQPKPGQTALVMGATGGVGLQVVQLLKAAGLRVIATARGEQERALLGRYGATETVDYTGDLASRIRALAPHGVDSAIHLAGDGAALLPLIRPGGSLVSTLVMSPGALPSESVSVLPVQMQVTPEHLQAIVENQRSGVARPEIQRRYTLDEASSVIDDFRAGTRGKLVIEI